MKKILALVALLCLVSAAEAQVNSLNAKRLYSGTAVPTWNCSPGPSYTDFYLRTSTGVLYYCTSAPATWSVFATAGGGGVTSITGTANQITASAATGAVTLSLPSTVIVSGATTTGPDVEVAMTGDTNSRVAIGLNTTDVPRLSMGPGNAVRDTFLERAAAANWRHGGVAVDTAPVAQTLSVQNTLAGGTSNVAGANFTIAGSQGKGTGVGGSLIFQVAPAGSTGTAVNALATALTIDSTRAATFASSISTSGVLQIFNGANRMLSLAANTGGGWTGFAYGNDVKLGLSC